MLKHADGINAHYDGDIPVVNSLRAMAATIMRDHFFIFTFQSTKL